LTALASPLHPNGKGLAFAGILLLGAACAPLPKSDLAPDAPIEARLAAAGLPNADAGFVVADLETGEILAERHADGGFMPASTLKVVTAFSALEVLGPGHRFTTAVLAKGKMADATSFEGDLWLRGGGDPLLGVQDVMALAGQLRDKGVERVSGRFHYDESAFASAAAIAPAQPEAAAYNPAVSALSLDFNRLHVNWRTTDTGALEADLTPATGTRAPTRSRLPHPPGRPFMAADGEGEAWRMDAARLSRPEGRDALPVRHPARRTAAVFRAVAERIGLDLPAPEPGAAPADSRPVAALVSAPLVDTLRPALRYSNNLVSELIGRAVGKRLTGKPVDRAASAAAVSTWLQGRLKDVDWRGAVLPNHSGLSAEARITPRQMAAVMTAALKARYGGGRFAAVLPAGGWDGALDGRFAAPATSGRVWAKSGTMHYAKGFTGLLFSETGRQLVFAFYMGDPAARRSYDADPSRLGSETQARAKAWIEKAESSMEDVIGRWIADF